MRQATEARRYGTTVPRVLVTLFLLAAAATAACGGEDSSTALQTVAPDAKADGAIDETSASRGPSRSSTTRSPSRTATTSRGSVEDSGSSDKGGPPAKGGDGQGAGSDPRAGNPTVTKAGPDAKGPTTTSVTKATDGPTKPPAGRSTTTSGGRTYPGLSENDRGAVVVPPGPAPAPPIRPPEVFIDHFDRIFEALPAKSPEVIQQSEDVVRLNREAPPESQQAVTGDTAVLIAAAEEVNRTKNVATYEKPEVRAAYQNIKAQQAQVPAGAGR